MTPQEYHKPLGIPMGLSESGAEDHPRTEVGEAHRIMRIPAIAAQSLAVERLQSRVRLLSWCTAALGAWCLVVTVATFWAALSG